MPGRRRFLSLVLGSCGLLPNWSSAAARGTRRLRKWQCVNQDCDPYIYDPAAGDENVADPDNPIPPGIAFEELPGSWACPVCNDPKTLFVPVRNG